MSTGRSPSFVPPPDPAGPHVDASAGQRVGALLIDTVVVVVPLFVLLAVLLGRSEAADGSVSVSLDGLPFLLLVFLVFDYYVVCELVWAQTLGKKVVGIRLVSDKGDRRTVGQVLVRTLMRVVDGFAFYLVAFVAVLASSKNQRLGDMAASTRVVRVSRQA